MSIRRRASREISYVPVGKPRSVTFGKVEPYGPAQSITLYVGQNRGEQAKNQSGACARRPRRFSAEEMDRSFAKLRAKQVGTGNVQATARAQRGWYEGAPEESQSYEVAFIPSDNEKTYDKFVEHMNAVAEGLAEEYCQDSVLMIRDDERGKTAWGAEWEE